VNGVPLHIRLLVMVEIGPGKSGRVDAYTLVVNAQGGLLEMTTRLMKGQKLLLSNPAAGWEERATVIGVRHADGNIFDVAFEFDNPAPNFWPMSFAPKN
jgi:hypothetical protein